MPETAAVKEIMTTETTHRDELLLESLRSVIDPEIGLNIVELGLLMKKIARPT